MKNVIFDFGNVVVHWNPFHALNGIFDTAEKMETKLQQIGFYQWNAEQDRGRSWSEAVQIAEQDMPEHAHIFRAYADGLVAAHSDLIPGTSDLILALHERDVPLFGLTNAAQASYDAVRAAAPALNHMRDVVLSADEGVIKPDPKIFHICLNRNNLIAGETLFIDDSLANCQGAESVGIAAHHFTDAAHLKTDLRQHGLLG